MNDYLYPFTETEKTILSRINDYACGLGYKAKRDKTRTVSYSFVHSRIRKQILRFSSSKGRPVIKLKYFSSQDYSEYFHERIRATIEEYNYRYTGCYGCGNCDGTQGYTCQYPDGRQFYRCGSELIEFFDLPSIPIEEFLELFKRQHEFYLSGSQVV